MTHTHKRWLITLHTHKPNKLHSYLKSISHGICIWFTLSPHNLHLHRIVTSFFFSIDRSKSLVKFACSKFNSQYFNDVYNFSRTEWNNGSEKEKKTAEKLELSEEKSIVVNLCNRINGEMKCHGTSTKSVWIWILWQRRKKKRSEIYIFPFVDKRICVLWKFWNSNEFAC